MPLTPNERTLSARAAAYTRWALVEDSTEATRPGREAFMARFDRMVPASITDPNERRVRAERLKKAHFSKLALASAKARRGET